MNYNVKMNYNYDKLLGKIKEKSIRKRPLLKNSECKQQR